MQRVRSGTAFERVIAGTAEKHVAAFGATHHIALIRRCQERRQAENLAAEVDDVQIAPAVFTE